MKLLFTLTVMVVLISCGEPVANDANTKKKPVHLVTFINNIAVNTPSWENNDLTRDDMREKLLKNFWKDIQDSNLLSGIPFQLTEIEKEPNDSLTATFKIISFTDHDVRDNISDSTRIDLELFSNIPDTLAKSLKQGESYFITSYTKNRLDTNYGSGSFYLLHNPSHTIYSCDLGHHYILNIKVTPTN